MTAQQPRTRDLDLWLVDKYADGVIHPGPGVVYDRVGLGIVVMDERGRDFTFTDTGHALEACAGQRARLSPALARDLAAALERFADFAEGLTAYVPHRPRGALTTPPQHPAPGTWLGPVPGAVTPGVPTAAAARRRWRAAGPDQQRPAPGPRAPGRAARAPFDATRADLPAVSRTAPA